MPFTVTEYNHSSPNRSAGEGPLFLATYASAQDWDGLFLFTWSHSAKLRQPSIWGLDIQAHPTVLANLAAAAMLFRRFDQPALTTEIRLAQDATAELALAAAKGKTW